MAVESAGCPYVKIPVPIQDTYSVAEIAILLRVSRNAVYEWSLLEDDPLPLRRMIGRKRGRFAFRDELLEWSKRTRRDCSQTEPFRTPRSDSSRDSSRPN